MKNQDSEYLDVDGAAKALDCSAQTIRPLLEQWRRSGGRTGLPHARIGRLIRTTREDIRRYYEAQKKVTALDTGD